ncbi:hypothetical protein EDB85DRAFT_1897991 [Lactarius pseudohatsudake]|nr:hypothetical protein EDB85DRAFT_1897991 [Lactarius pseudohatsudake]
MDVEGKPVVTGTQSVESRKGTEAENVPQIKVSYVFTATERGTAYRVYIAFKDNPQTVKYQRGNEKEHGDKRDSYFEELLPSLDAPREGELRRSAQPSPYERAAIRARSHPSRLTKEHGVQADMLSISRRDDPDTEHVSQRKTDSPRAAAALCEDENGE